MTNTNNHLTAMFLSFLVVSSAMVLLIPPKAEAQATPDFTLEVSPGEIKLDVSPRGTGVGTTQVTVTSQSAHTITVEVQINLPGYTVSPQISTVTLGAGASTTINVAVAAMVRTPYKVGQGNVNGEVTRVDGVAVSTGYTANTGFIVTSKPYGKVILQSEKPFQKVSPGKEYPFQIKVQNNGNAIDTYSIEITNKDKLQDDGFSITLSTTETKNVDMGGHDNIIIQVQTPRDTWKNDYFTIDIKAESDVTPSESTAYSITVWVWGFYVPGFEITFTIIALAVVGTFLARKKQNL